MRFGRVSPLQVSKFTHVRGQYRLKKEVKRIVKENRYRIVEENIDIITVARDYEFEIKFSREQYGYKITVSPPVRYRDFFIPKRIYLVQVREGEILTNLLKDGLKNKFKILLNVRGQYQKFSINGKFVRRMITRDWVFSQATY